MLSMRVGGLILRNDMMRINNVVLVSWLAQLWLCHLCGVHLATRNDMLHSLHWLWLHHWCSCHLSRCNMLRGLSRLWLHHGRRAHLGSRGNVLQMLHGLSMPSIALVGWL